MVLNELGRNIGASLSKLLQNESAVDERVKSRKFAIYLTFL